MVIGPGVDRSAHYTQEARIGCAEDATHTSRHHTIPQILLIGLGLSVCRALPISDLL